MTVSEIVEAIIKLVSVTVWPVTIITLVLIFRQQVVSLFDRLKKLTKGDLQLELFEVASGYIEDSIDALEAEDDPSKRKKIIENIKSTAILLQSIHPISLALLSNLSESHQGEHSYHGITLNHKSRFAQELVDKQYAHWEVQQGENDKIDKLSLRQKGYDFLVSVGCEPAHMRAKRELLKP